MIPNKNSMLARWRDGKLSSTEFLALLGKMMEAVKKQKNKEEIKKLQEIINEVLGMPEEPPDDDDLDKQAWERYHRGE